jgi:hypothetical protein
MVHASPSPFYASRIYYYGRDHGPVQERTYLMSIDRRWGIQRSKYLEASLGVAMMNEKIDIDFEESDDFDLSEDNYNLGAHFGLSSSIPFPGPLHMSASWDSHLFPAGPNGGLFLATGRKMTISLMMGAKF